MHGELKLENLLLDERGHLKLVDFGKYGVLRNQSSCGMAVSLLNIAPEFIKGQRYSFQADWWAVGTILH